jgi:hypothetical protein
MNKIRTFEVIVKEKMIDNPIKTSYVGKCTEEDVIKFFGLRENDIEWYKITEIV